MKTLYIPMVTLLAIGLSSCGPKTEKTVNTAAEQASAAASDLGNETSNAFASAANKVSPTPSGQEFADQAAKSDAFEIAAGKLAISHAASAKIQAFGRDMVAAHTESTAKIKDAARRASAAITPDATLTPDQQNELAKLGKVTGADFDHEYLAGQIDAHEHALSLMQDYAEHGDVAPLKTAAAAIAPIVQKHLGRAKVLAR